jgi:hypothetical protein
MWNNLLLQKWEDFYFTQERNFTYGCCTKQKPKQKSVYTSGDSACSVPIHILSLNQLIFSSQENFSKQTLQYKALIQKKITFFIDRNCSLCCLQQTVHSVLALQIFSSLPPPECDKKDKAKFN